MEPLTPQVMHKLVFTILVHGLPDAQTGIALDVLTDAQKNPNGQVRELAVVALAELAVSPSKRVAALTTALKDPYARVRRRAARALGDFGTHALAALPALVNCLRDPDPSVRRDAAGTSGRLGPAAQAAAPGLVTMLGEPETRTRVVAAASLRKVGRPALGAVVQGLGHIDPELRGRCATLLGQMAPDDPQVAAALRLVVEDDDAEVRRRAGEALTHTPSPMDTTAPVGAGVMVAMA
ncbi:HEAT repeat domain-containing protein [Urbifossiella limnaea]|uniref:HEAT repeat protein n=1 Tax=Urbifossiella limnaea TaxID=2528023 RepID=A0A517XLK0_9BACT|nr:HEAT repeat domain-containing protein [Urbifossiella limnaea]QDU18378.1 HEAT repeat protein [Urbifossiella limnaea]